MMIDALHVAHATRCYEMFKYKIISKLWSNFDKGSNLDPPQLLKLLLSFTYLFLYISKSSTFVLQEMASS